MNKWNEKLRNKVVCKNLIMNWKMKNRMAVQQQNYHTMIQKFRMNNSVIRVKIPWVESKPSSQSKMLKNLVIINDDHKITRSL